MIWLLILTFVIGLVYILVTYLDKLPPTNQDEDDYLRRKIEKQLRENALRRKLKKIQNNERKSLYQN